MVSIDSAALNAGRIDGTRLASIVLPEPGGPTISRLCAPAAATEAQFELGLVLLEEGKRAEAVQAFRAYVALSPASPYAAKALERAGDGQIAFVANGGGGMPRFADLLSAADRAVYEAKRSGRNRTVAAGDDTLSAATARAQFGQMTGSVIGEDGKPWANGVVSIDREDIKGHYEVKTNKEGKFFHAGLPLGKFSVTVMKDGKPLFKQGNITTRMNEPAKVDINLREERARTELGMIHSGETFYQVAPSPAAPER